jgi:hypothetical protein
VIRKRIQKWIWQRKGMKEMIWQMKLKEWGRELKKWVEVVVGRGSGERMLKLPLEQHQRKRWRRMSVSFVLMEVNLCCVIAGKNNELTVEALLCVL